MAIEDFEGLWKSNGWHTNPWKPVVNDGDSPKVPEAWVSKEDYYPPSGLHLQARKTAGNIFDRKYNPEPQLAAGNTDIIKFTIIENGAPIIPPGQKKEIENADYYLLPDGKTLVSSPILANAEDRFTEVITLVTSKEMDLDEIKIHFPEYDGHGGEEWKAMIHTLLWSGKTAPNGDVVYAGYRAFWPCCFFKKLSGGDNAAANPAEGGDPAEPKAAH